MSALAVSVLLLVCPLFPVLAQTQDGAAAKTRLEDNVPPGATIQAGTRITLENWQKYKQFMPDGMIALFQGGYYWKMPPDMEMEVGPTVLRPLPKTYLDATEKYASQVTVVELPDGGLSLKGYQGGAPFSHPTDPHRDGRSSQTSGIATFLICWWIRMGPDATWTLSATSIAMRIK